MRAGASGASHAAPRRASPPLRGQGRATGAVECQGSRSRGKGAAFQEGKGEGGTWACAALFFFPGTPLVSARGTVTIARQPPLGTWPSVALGLSALTTSGAAAAAAACGSRRARRRTSSLPARSMPRRAARAGAPRSVRGARSRRSPRDEALGGGDASAYGEAPYTYQKQQISSGALWRTRRVLGARAWPRARRGWVQPTGRSHS